MKKTYQEFLKRSIDISPLGIKKGTNGKTYFCTPQGASVIGWEEVDGIHYCFIRGFGEMVFAVNPSNAASDCVHPLASDFNDFLRLLLACGNVAALEQAWLWNRIQFETYLSENPPTDEQEAILSGISGKMSLTAMEDPFSYIKELQESFDYSKIKYTKDYYNAAAGQAVPEWKVRFFNHQGRNRTAKEIPMNKHFLWGDEEWYIPSVYVCSEGLVIDFLKKVPADQIKAFMGKYNLNTDSSHTDFPLEMQLRIDADNPLSVDIKPAVTLNGKPLRSVGGSGFYWNPLFPEINRSDTIAAIQHHGLSPEFGWTLNQWSFKWSTKRPPRLTSLDVTMARQKTAFPGPHFKAASAGETLQFLHPVTNVLHTLTVMSVEQHTIDVDRLPQDAEYPANCVAISYKISPGLSRDSIQVHDTAPSDSPRQKNKDSQNHTKIGSVSSLTAILPDKSETHTACSALHFEPVKDVEWFILFHEKPKEDIFISLI